MSYTLKPSKLKLFDRYDFIKSFVALTSDSQAKAQEEKKAEIIASAIQEIQNTTFQNLATKDDLKNLEFLLKKDIQTFESSLRGEMKTLESSLRGDMQTLESSLRGDMQTLESSLRGEMKTLEISLKKDMQGHLIKLGSLMIILLTILPLLNDFIKRLFGL